MGDAQVFGLPAGHAAVELRVAEQRGTGASSRTCVVSHCECRPWEHMKHWPQHTWKGITTRSPGFSFVTPEPTSSTMPIGS